jgi:carbonic anhydrase
MTAPAAPARKLAVITCMDARVMPVQVLGLRLGDAHVIRNAGGIVTDDAVRSLAVSQRLLGTEEVIVIHHTGCGMLNFDDSEFRHRLEAETGVAPAWREDGPDTVEQGVRDSVARIRASPFLLHRDRVRGFVYDVETHSLNEVVCGSS